MAAHYSCLSIAALTEHGCTSQLLICSGGTLGCTWQHELLHTGCGALAKQWHIHSLRANKQTKKQRAHRPKLCRNAKKGKMLKRGGKEQHNCFRKNKFFSQEPCQMLHRAELTPSGLRLPCKNHSTKPVLICLPSPIGLIHNAYRQTESGYQYDLELSSEHNSLSWDYP
eukprot:1161358-Pelagomonas_calceolata.AAC.4